MKFNLGMDVNKMRKINLFVPKNTTRVNFFYLCLAFFLFYFFYNFHMKQEILVDNKIENKKKERKMSQKRERYAKNNTKVKKSKWLLF